MATGLSSTRVGTVQTLVFYRLIIIIPRHSSGIDKQTAHNVTGSELCSMRAPSKKESNTYQGESSIMKTLHTVRTVSSILLLGMVMGINPATMAEDSQTAAPVTDEEKVAWTPPPPDDFDWIQLNSGEWLKGEFKALYDEKVEFDSEEVATGFPSVA
jgi:hypothetical protein